MSINLQNLGLIYNHQYEAFIISEPNYTFQFEHITPKKQKYFFILRYNCSVKPNISLKINNITVSNNLLKINTMSHNKLVSFNIQLGPFLLKEGNNDIRFICKGTFPLLYNLEIIDTPRIMNTRFIINDYFKLRMSDFILLDNYNAYGGFYWHIYNYIVCNLVGDKFNKIPIINFNGSLYRSNTDEVGLIHNNTNWFYNYFNYNLDIPYTAINTVINFPHKINFVKKNIKDYNIKSDDYIYNFNYDSFGDFNYLSLQMTFSNKRKYIQNKIKLLPYIQELFLNIKKKIFPESKPNQKFIGIHYRGTDKVEEGTYDEEHPIHYNYEIVYKILNEKIKDLNETDETDVYVVITTDEIPFLEHMKEKLGNKIIHYQEGDRSNINTSGLNYNFQQTPTRDKIYDKRILRGNARQEMILKERLINNSIHMGSKHLSNYKKGLDCIIDVLMLQDCDIIYKSKGNFSNFCTYLNTNPNLEVIELHECL
jgi:hypothetical protein